MFVKHSAPALLVALFACSGEMNVDDGASNRTQASWSSADAWSGNLADCPATPPIAADEFEITAPRTSCHVAEGQICAWYARIEGAPSTEYRACVCAASSTTATHWYCYNSIGIGTYSCPTSEPENGSVCPGLGAAQCFYPPFTRCRCGGSGSDLAWSCGTEPPVADNFAIGHPTTLDESKPVKDLDDAERRAFCEWYVTTSPGSGPEPLETPLTPDGYVTNVSCTNGPSFPCAGRLPRLPIGYCTGNLALSSCTAPTSELADCVLTINKGCWPSPHGCARYLDTPGCAGTLVLAGSFVPYSSMGCELRVR